MPVWGATEGLRVDAVEGVILGGVLFVVGVFGVVLTVDAVVGACVTLGTALDGFTEKKANVQKL